jgi:TatD DNase family protein
MHEKHPGFVYSTIGLHPVDALKLKDRQIDDHVEFIRKNRESIVGIGEVGLDYYYVKDPLKIKRTKEIFARFIELSKELNLPVIVHSRDATAEAIKILNDHDAKKILLHCFGEHKMIEIVKENNFSITLPPIIATSKNHRKIAKRLPIELIMTETDSPWFGGEGKRGLPTNVKIVIEKIAKERGMNFEDVDRITTENARKFYNI